MSHHVPSTCAAVGLAALLVQTGGLIALQAPPSRPQDSASRAIEVLPVQGRVSVLVGAGGNIALHVGKDGVLMVDTGLAASSAQVLAEIRKLSNGPIRWIVNTHLHPDHVGGNAAIAGIRPDPLLPLNIVAHENVLNRLTAALRVSPPAEPPRGLPIDEYFTPTKDIHFNDEAVVMYHEPKAHTDGDTVLLFRGSDVVSTGDIFTPDAYPFIDLENGGSLQGEIDAVNHILQLTVPSKTQEGGTYVIPGHGRVCDEADLVEFRDMLVIVRDRVRDLISKRMTLAQVTAARPTLDYDGAYVSPGSFVTTDRFVEAVYKSLSPPSAATPAKSPAPSRRK